MGLRVAVRQIVRQRWVALGIVTVLATSVAVSTALFAVIDGLLIKRLPLVGADRLVAVLRVPGTDGGATPLAPVHLDAAASLPGIQALTAYAQIGRVEWRGQVIRQAAVMPNFFETLSVRAEGGRLLARGDAGVEGLLPAVVGHRLWARLQELSPGLQLGGSLRIASETYLVVGVAPEGFDFPRGTSLWVPLTERTLLESAKFNYLTGLAVLGSRPEGTREITARERFRLTPLEEHERPGAAVPVAALLALSSVVLVVGWLQVSTLQIGAAAGRAREYRVMTALGARSRDLVTIAMSETTLLGGVAVLLGLLLSVPLLDAIVAVLPPDFLAGRDIAIDWRAASFAATVAFAGLMACGAALAHVLARFAGAQMATDRRESTPRPWGGSAYLLGGQVCVAAALLYVSGICVRSVANITSAPLGFETARLYCFSASAADGGDISGAALESAADDLRRASNGRLVATSYAAPFGGLSLVTGVEAEDGQRSVQAEANYVSPEYLGLLGVHVQEGRLLERIDTGAPAPAGILGNAAARALGVTLAGGTPYIRVLGQRARVVGIIDDLKTAGPEAEAPAQIYLLQGSGFPARVLTTRVSSPGELERTRTILSRSLRGAQVNVRSLEAAAIQWTAPHRGRALILSVVSVGAWLVTLMGLYAAAAAAGRARVRDTAIRLALGASSRNVVVVAGRSLLTALVMGAGCGVAGGVALSVLVRSVVFGVPSFDVAGIAASMAALVLCGAAAVAGPLYRASRLDLVTALKDS